MKYVRTKILKRLELNKIRGGFHERSKSILLPVSLGVSSIALLHVLDQQLQNRVDQGRHAGYTLHVLHLDDADPESSEAIGDRWKQLEQRYPSHVYSELSLQDCHKYGIKIGPSPLENAEQFDPMQALSAMSSATSRADLVEQTRRRLILAFAQKLECDSILFGDSTTRLAERILSETAKGRGGELPLLTSDGLSRDHNCIFPSRDLLRKELSAYAEIVEPPLTPLIMNLPKAAPASSKDITIDGLMSRYFETVEQNYPSIVANVVRTSGRLRAPS